MLLCFCHLPCHAHVCYKAVHPVTQCLLNVHERYRYKKVIISCNFFFLLHCISLTTGRLLKHLPWPRDKRALKSHILHDMSNVHHLSLFK